MTRNTPRLSLLKKTLAALVLAAALLYALLTGGVWWFQEDLMFNGRTAELVATPAAEGWAFQDIWLDTPGGRTHGWWIPLENARRVVMFSHGSGKNISHYLDDAAIYRELGCSVLLYDYGGYGQSGGEPSEARCCADARAMWNHLTGPLGVPPERILLIGASMGGGVTADLATVVTPGAIMLECTFTSVPDVFADTYGWVPIHWISRINYKNIEKVGKYQRPVLVAHSRDDTVVPFAHAERLYEKITAPKMFLELRGGHGGCKFESKDAYTAALKAFLEKHMPEK